MNVFNRIVVVILLLVLMLLAALLAVFPMSTLTVAQRGLQVAGDYLRGVEASRFWLFVLARVLLVLAVVLICALLLWGEIRPPRVKSVHVRTQPGSQAEVTADSVARRLAWHLDQLADVMNVTPHVSPHGQAVDVVLDLETSPDIDVPMKTEEVVQCAREIIVDRMGLQVGKIQVRMTHAPYREEG